MHICTCTRTRTHTHARTHPPDRYQKWEAQPDQINHELEEFREQVQHARKELNQVGWSVGQLVGRLVGWSVGRLVCVETEWGAIGGGDVYLGAISPQGFEPGRSVCVAHHRHHHLPYLAQDLRQNLEAMYHIPAPPTYDCRPINTYHHTTTTVPTAKGPGIVAGLGGHVPHPQRRSHCPARPLVPRALGGRGCTPGPAGLGQG